MDGHTLLRDLRGILSETATSSFLEDRLGYDYLWEAAKEFNNRTRALTTTQSITTTAETSEYNLAADFFGLYLTDDENRHFIKYNDGTDTSFIYYDTYESIVLSNNTTSQSVPNGFSIKDASAISNYTGTTTSNGASSNGECTLTDSGATFTYASAGDTVHNVTDGSHGIVLEKSSSTALVTALFDGTGNDWTSGDSYVVVPQGRYSLKLDPPSSTASHTVTVDYLKVPAPVYAPYRSYKFSPQYKMALVFYAAWLYKYRDGAPDFGDSFYIRFDSQCRRAAYAMDRALKRTDFSVNMKKR